MDQAPFACYIRALRQMCDDRNPEHRQFARTCLADMGEPGVSVLDYLRPYMTRPLSELDGPERRLRLLATNHPLAVRRAPVSPTLYPTTAQASA